MNCEDVSARLKAWIDGELEPHAATRVREHVAACPSCQETERSYRALAARIRTAPPLVVPRCDPGGIRDEVRRRRRELETTVRFLKRTALAAAAVLVASIGLWLVPGGPVPAATWAPPETAGGPVANRPVDDYDALGTLFTNLDSWPSAVASGEFEWDG